MSYPSLVAPARRHSKYSHLFRRLSRDGKQGSRQCQYATNISAYATQTEKIS